MLLVAFISVAAASAASPVLTPKKLVVQRFAECSLRNHPEKSVQALASVPDSREEARALRHLASLNDRCLGDRAYLSMQSGKLRGALAEMLLKRDGGLSIVRGLPARAPVPVTGLGGRAFIIAFAQCLATSNPVRSAALLDSEIGSAAEGEAVAAMESDMAACVPEKTRLRIDLEDIRAHVADALYRVVRTDRSREAAK